MRERLRAYDAFRWATDFLTALDRVKAQQGRLETRSLTPKLAKEVARQYRSARQRMLLLDYDGTLVPLAPLPHLAAPDAEILELLGRLAAAPDAAVYLISGRDRQRLSEWFLDPRLHLIAEHGAWIRSAGTEWRMLKPLASEWKETLKPILSVYVDRLPGSMVEEKEYSLAWHYRNADGELGPLRAKELMDDLVQYTANFDVQVLEGKKVVEIRNAGVNKGIAALQCLNEVQPDCVLAIGDDQTDEELFRALPDSAVTIRVGWPFSLADYTLNDPTEVRQFLRELAAGPSVEAAEPPAASLSLWASLWRHWRNRVHSADQEANRADNPRKGASASPSFPSARPNS
jgi:trehalose 6-phosphate synthase/phosphatase